MSMSAQDQTLSSLSRLLAEQADLQVGIVFGSVARGCARPDSDIDIAVLADEPLDAERKRQLIEAVAQATGRPVDLVDLRTAGVAVTRSALLGGRRLFCRNNAAYAAVLSRMLADSADFLPYRERLLKERLDAWIR